jgi:hypothetical protein
MEEEWALITGVIFFVFGIIGMIFPKLGTVGRGGRLWVYIFGEKTTIALTRIIFAPLCILIGIWLLKVYFIK